MSIGTPVVNAPNLYINGLGISWVSATELQVAVGICRDSTNQNDISVGLPLNVAQTGTGEEPVAAGSGPVIINVAVQGAGGLDTGTIAVSTVYGVYALGDSMNVNLGSAILSASQSAPLIPYGYDMYRLIGYATTDGSGNLLLGYWSAGNSSLRTFTYDAPIATSVTAGASTSYAGVDLTEFVPAVDGTSVSVAYSFLPGNAAGDALYLQGYNSTGDAVKITGQVTSVHMTGNATVLAQLHSGAPEIKYKVTSASSSEAAALNVASYTVSL